MIIPLSVQTSLNYLLLLMLCSQTLEDSILTPRKLIWIEKGRIYFGGKDIAISILNGICSLSIDCWSFISYAPGEIATPDLCCWKKVFLLVSEGFRGGWDVSLITLSYAKYELVSLTVSRSRFIDIEKLKDLWVDEIDELPNWALFPYFRCAYQQK